VKGPAAEPIDEGLSGAEPLPDPKALGADKALQKVDALAAVASEADAPRLYRHALDIAGELPPARSQATAARILEKAGAQAPEAVPKLAGKAFESAAAGRRKETRRYSDAVSGWNSLLSVPGEPYIANLPEFQAAVERIQAQAGSSRGVKLPTPKAFVETLPGRVRPRLVLKVQLSARMASDVPAVPEALAQGFGLADMKSFVAWGELPEAGPSLRSSFDLAPQGGLGAFYRAERAAGRSVLSSFWLSSRKWLAARAEGALARLRRMVVRLLQSLGIMTGAAPASFEVQDSEDLLRGLRALPAQDASVEAPAALPEDPYRLGYQVHPLVP
jgi:hypothetical protein